MEQILRSGLSALGLPEDCVPALERYAQLLLEKNKVMNLTAITEPEQVATLHFLDSLCLLQAVDFAGRTAADIGTGAGFPGLPLRIAVPSLRLTLLDAQGKRVDFLREVCGELGLSDVACVHARAEEFAAHRRESFDLVTSRAVAALPMLAELGLPLVRVGGRFIAMKSVDSGEELESAAHAISLLGGRVERVWDYTIPGTEIVHRAIIIEKTAATPAKYPRAFAKIKKQPL
jgi:16S rRNA (guanine(527)-N(7))-methyltransferase GidB